MINHHTVELHNVTVTYRSHKGRPESIRKAMLAPMKSKGFRRPTFDALKDITLRIPRGESLGIIGDNGAGKSTLIKVIAGILPPTWGTVTTHGSIDCLMQLGAGFDQELNAYDNILLYSTLRLSTYREAKESVNSILDFAELHEFANTPIKYYSSGMRARLGFAVALNCKPDLLILDEVLAVGDAHFRLKCKDAFAQLLAQSKTIIMASHSMQSIQQSCKNSIVLSKGAIVYQGASTDAIALYVDKSQKCSDLTT